MEFTIEKNGWYKMLEKACTLQGAPLITWITEKLKTAELIQEREDCGKTIKELLEERQLEPMEVMGQVFGSYGTAELHCFVHLTILGDEENPCPECGCKLEVEIDGADGYQWEESKCLNGDCDYRSTTEPDWDMMPGGIDYEY